MANRFFTPNAQFLDETGTPYSGGKLYFYTTGTNTLYNTYSESTLTTPNANPIVLDSAGRAGNIFLDNVAYKVVLKDSSDNIIWTVDPVWSSDYSAVAQFRAWNGNPNGAVAGTAGTQGGLPSSVVWDYTNSNIYVCTTTGNAAAAVWTSANPATAATAVPKPGGRLTLVSATPVLASDVNGVAGVYYTPYVGNNIPIYSGSAFTVQTFSELSLSLVSAHSANAIYDVFVFNNSGTLTAVTGPAWTTATAGAGARGSGAGTTQISRLNGIWVNTVQITGRNGATTYTIAANLATYVGSIYIDGSVGTISNHISYGQSRKVGVWNAYNRVPLILTGGDSTASWVYGTNTIRASNGSSANSVTVFSGLPEELVRVQFNQDTRVLMVGTGAQGNSTIIGIGLNSTTAFSGTVGKFVLNNSIGQPVLELQTNLTASYVLLPFIGINTFTSLEQTPAAGGTVTYYGTETEMRLLAHWMG